jgi:four helix bundle protein
VKPLIEVIGKHDGSLADQMKRAASSVVLNVAEPGESLGGNQRVRFRTALGSAAEVGAALDVAQAWGYVGREQGRAVREALGRIRPMLSRLVR